jgi:hypothetical protein
MSGRYELTICPLGLFRRYSSSLRKPALALDCFGGFIGLGFDRDKAPMQCSVSHSLTR